MDYSQFLDDDILEKIVHDHLPKFSDRFRFSLVCKSWNFLANRSCRRQLLPGLLSRVAHTTDVYQFLPFSNVDLVNEDYPDDGYVCPCSRGGTGKPVRRRPINMLPRVRLPIVGRDFSYQGNEMEVEHIVASLYGWLLIANPRLTSSYRCQQLQLYLLNPITRALVALPRRPPTLALLLSSRNDIIKAVLSSSPDNIQVDWHVIVLLKSRPYLAWCDVLGEGRGWKLLSNYIFKTQPEDVSYHGETLYVMDSKNVYVVRDLIVTSSDRNYSVRAVSLSSLPVYNSFDEPLPVESYLLLAPDLAGQLLIIYHCGDTAYESVYRLVGSSRDYSWERVRSLDGYALFIGNNIQSFGLPASDDHNGVMSNRIYFPCGVFNLECRCFAIFDYPKGVGEGGIYFWFLPMLRDVIGEHMKSKKGVGMRNGKSKVFSYWIHDEEQQAMLLERLEATQGMG
ncbi:hypothetical protein LINGRAHAP2_LOCUS13179 [Linum grandiflorum]